jgi:hypothetical protein
MTRPALGDTKVSDQCYKPNNAHPLAVNFLPEIFPRDRDQGNHPCLDPHIRAESTL